MASESHIPSIGVGRSPEDRVDLPHILVVFVFLVVGTDDSWKRHLAVVRKRAPSGESAFRNCNLRKRIDEVPGIRLGGQSEQYEEEDPFEDGSSFHES